MEDNKVYSVRGEGHKWQIFPMSENGFYYDGSLSYFTIDRNTQNQQVMNFYSNLAVTPEISVKQQVNIFRLIILSLLIIFDNGVFYSGHEKPTHIEC